MAKIEERKVITTCPYCLTIMREVFMFNRDLYLCPTCRHNSQRGEKREDGEKKH